MSPSQPYFRGFALKPPWYHAVDPPGTPAAFLCLVMKDFYPSVVAATFLENTMSTYWRLSPFSCSRYLVLTLFLHIFVSLIVDY